MNENEEVLRLIPVNEDQDGEAFETVGPDDTQNVTDRTLSAAVQERMPESSVYMSRHGIKKVQSYRMDKSSMIGDQSVYPAMAAIPTNSHNESYEDR